MSMKYKLIAMDLDGTLLDNQKRVSERAKRDLHLAKEMGIEIVFLSGRMFDAIRIIEEQIGFSCIKASSAGTYITVGDQCAADSLLSNADMLFLYKNIAEKYHVPLWVYKGRNWYVSASDKYVEYESNIIQIRPKISSPETLAAAWSLEGTGPNKLLFGADPDIIDKIKEDLLTYNSDSFDFARSADMYLEIFPKGANKGTALQTICQILKIKPENTIAFGDQELDIPLLQAAGFGVAVANAPQSVLDAADAITFSNEKDGVAAALETYVLK